MYLRNSTSNPSPTQLNLPLMENNITHEDRQTLIEFLKQDKILTQSENVREFESEWSKWLGVKYSVFVNSGSSANLATWTTFRELYGTGEIIVPTLTWVSDIASVIQCGFKPVFVDIDPKTLGMSTDQVISKVNSNTKAVFLTHILGYNALTQKLLDFLQQRNIPLIEDACESHGATFKNQKAGTFGLASNFSFYFAHHLTTIEGGMISTNDSKFYETVRMIRSHGLVREVTSDQIKTEYIQKYPDLNPEFIFAFPAFNIRSTEINAVLGRNQLKRLSDEIKQRNRNLIFFLNHLDSKKYRTDFELEGCSNYAFTLVLREPNDAFRDNVMRALKSAGVEFRRGTSGGGNQLRQPYLRKLIGENEYQKYPNVNHIHFYGFYIGNYPTLGEEKIVMLCDLLNSVN